MIVKVLLESKINKSNRDANTKNQKFEAWNLEVIISMIKGNSKIYVSRLFDEAVNDPIHGRHWNKTIEKEVQNLKNHQTQEYEKLLYRKKVVGSKWIIKVTYHPNNLVARFKVRLMA